MFYGCPWCRDGVLHPVLHLNRLNTCAMRKSHSSLHLDLVKCYLRYHGFHLSESIKHPLLDRVGGYCSFVVSLALLMPSSSAVATSCLPCVVQLHRSKIVFLKQTSGLSWGSLVSQSMHYIWLPINKTKKNNS